MQKLYIVCGIPVSGKTSVAGKIAEKERAVIISFDEIRRALFPGKKYRPSQIKPVFNELWLRLMNSLSAGQSIVIDAMNKTPAERIRYIQAGKEHGYQIVCIFCKKHFSHAVIENKRRNVKDRYPESLIGKLYHEFIPPDVSEGWDVIFVMDGDWYSAGVDGHRPLKQNRRRKGAARHAEHTAGT